MLASVLIQALRQADADRTTDLRVVLVLAAVFIDMQYFERKAGN